MSSDWRPQKPIGGFWLVVAVLFLLRLLLGFLTLPAPAAIATGVLMTAVFVALPVLGLFWGGSKDWSVKSSLAYVFVGILLHLGAFAAISALKPEGVPLLLLRTLMQTGVPVWCLGLGALVSRLVKEKNMVLPIAVFLAGMDALLILAPMTPQAKIVAQNPEIMRNLAFSVPLVKQTQESGAVPVGAVDLAYIGPADLFISAMLFCSIFRYGMRAKKTVVALVPTLFAYLVVVLATRFPLPALVPIGVVVLAVNWKEFKLSREERAATWLVTVVAVAMAALGLFLRLNYKPKELPAGSSQTETEITVPAPEDSPAPTNPDQRR